MLLGGEHFFVFAPVAIVSQISAAICENEIKMFFNVGVKYSRVLPLLSMELPTSSI